MWLVLAASAGGLIISSLLKHEFERRRPSVVPHLATVYTSSFPSGHSMMASAVYLTLGALLTRIVPERSAKVYFIAVAILVAILVGLSRVYLGVHYPTDVLAGWTAGSVWALVCWQVARYLQQRGTVERDTEPPQK
jgi:undecaprenyl-diphosphatase